MPRAQPDKDAFYRNSDPMTAVAAAASANTNRLENAVLSALKSAGARGLTSQECADATGEDRVAVSPRFRPLEQRGLIVGTPFKRTAPGRRPSKIWVLQTYEKQAHRIAEANGGKL